MCGGVKFTHNEQELTIYFPNPKAVLPVLNKDKSISLLPWGRRKEQAGYLPQGGWARLDSIQQGLWGKYHAIPVKLAVQRFMEKDSQGVSHWFDLAEHQYIQGLVASHGDELRVYVVTVKAETSHPIHARWPRIIEAL
jgi:hypothetical protein